MMDAVSGQESMEFRAEVQQLLHILAHSLYTEREIFLRELISNASDALHRIQFEMLTNRDVLDPDAELVIRIDCNEQDRTLTVSDTGIGMTREELIENLGTIAHSGAMAFLKTLEDARFADARFADARFVDTRGADIIGQFGVGFYSAFMVADEITVTTRSYRPDAAAWRWTSRGDSHFSISPAERANRGTTVTIKLKEDAAEFASAWRLEQIVKKHSNYVSFPIYVKDNVANQQTALWRKSPQEVEEQEYAGFYRQLTLDFQPPLLHIHLVADAPVNVRAILYVPRQRERGPLRLRGEQGLKLYSKKILIQEGVGRGTHPDLLPEYLSFVEGVVDSEDLPLNISRETVQSSPAMRQLQKALTARIFKGLREMADERPADYATFWNEFGVFIKQGVVTDPLNHADLLPLLRFHSSKSGDNLTSLSEYVERMPTATADHQAIYYILGTDRASVVHSPHLDYFKTCDIEVLYLLDPLDGFMAHAIKEFAGKPFQNVDDPKLQLPQRPAAPAAEGTEKERPDIPQADFDQLVARFKAVLGERVTEVRESHLLTDHPCRLVSPGDDMLRDLHRIRRILDEDFQVPPRLLELNRRHPLIENLARLVNTQPAAAVIDLVIEQLFDNLLLLDGLHPNPAQMTPRIEALLEAATKQTEH